MPPYGPSLAPTTLLLVLLHVLLLLVVAEPDAPLAPEVSRNPGARCKMRLWLATADVPSRQCRRRPLISLCIFRPQSLPRSGLRGLFDLCHAALVAAVRQRRPYHRLRAARRRGV